MEYMINPCAKYTFKSMGYPADDPGVFDLLMRIQKEKFEPSILRIESVLKASSPPLSETDRKKIYKTQVSECLGRLEK